MRTTVRGGTDQRGLVGGPRGSRTVHKPAPFAGRRPGALLDEKSKAWAARRSRSSQRPTA